MRGPVLACAGFVAGDVALQQVPTLPAPALCVLAGIAALALALGAAAPWACRRGPRAALAAALAAGVLAGFSYAGALAHARLAEQLDRADEGVDLAVEGIVTGLPSAFEGGIRFEAEIEAGARPRRAPRHVALSWYAADARVLPGERWAWTVRLRRPQAAVNPGGFDAEAWLLEEGVRALGTVRAGRHDPPPQLLEADVGRFDTAVDRTRARVRERLVRTLGAARYGAVVIALVMGDQGLIGQDDWALFNRTGISHLVSISGLHITMIAAACASLAGLAWGRSTRLLAVASRPVVRAVAAIAGGLAYCLLAGWGVPAQRTLIMLAVAALGLCLRARPAPVTILALAAALVCLWDPWAVLAAGFWLSFGAVSCLFLLGHGRPPQAASRLQGLRDAVHVQAAITVGQVPLTLAIFGQVSVVAPLANALAIPAVSFVVAPLALGGAALQWLGPWGAALGAPLLTLSERVFAWLAQWLEWLVRPSWSWLALPMPPDWTFVVAAAGCAWLLAPPGWPWRAAGLLALAPMLIWPSERPGPADMWVSAPDIGQGMALVIETRDAVLVFDTGPRYSPQADAAGRVLVPFLRARGWTAIDALVVSHQDIDHAGGVRALATGFDVRFVLSSVAPSHPLMAGAPAPRRCEAGQRLAVGRLRLRVLSPAAALYEAARAGTNARSCVVLAELGGHRVLLTGDVPARQERELVHAARQAADDLHVDLLVAPHHGSHTSSSAELLDATHPAWTSMQVGYRNHFGHPHPEVLARYAARGIAIARSDRCGAAQWRFHPGLAPRLVCWRTDHPRYWYNRTEAP